jgi:hypothetical protein
MNNFKKKYEHSKMLKQALEIINANNGVHWHTASCVLSNSKRFAYLKTTCPVGENRPPKSGIFD